MKKTTLDKTIWLAENLLGWQRVHSGPEARHSDKSCFLVENCNVIVCNSLGEPLWPWEPFVFVDNAWDVVESIIRAPITRDQAERMPNTRFVHQFNASDLWAYPSERAAELICHFAIKAMGFNSDTLEKLTHENAS